MKPYHKALINDVINSLKEIGHFQANPGSESKFFKISETTIAKMIKDLQTILPEDDKTWEQLEALEAYNRTFKIQPFEIQ